MEDEDIKLPLGETKILDIAIGEIRGSRTKKNTLLDIAKNAPDPPPPPKKEE